MKARAAVVTSRGSSIGKQSDVARSIESVFIAGPAGRLEALLEEPDDAPTQAVLVCHPHPLYSGSMHNKVVYRIAHGFRRVGGVALRFNYRGVGKSEGVYDHGVGEIADAAAALAFLRDRYPDLPYSIAGFSFGSRIALHLACAAAAPKPTRVIPVGVPVLRTRFDEVLDCPLPKYFVQSTNDEYGPVADTKAAVERFAEPKQLFFIESKDHFFVDGLEKLEETIAGIAATRP
jgi:alpha/beta superfamily hydrolase